MLLQVIKSLQHVRHSTSCLKARVVDRWGQHLPHDLRQLVIGFLDVSTTMSLLSVNSSWNRLRFQERFCRHLYHKLFGECDLRDQDIFGFHESSWRQRFSIRFATMHNWMNACASQALVLTTHGGDNTHDEWVIDGSILEGYSFRHGSIGFDLDRQGKHVKIIHQKFTRRILKDPNLIVHGYCLDDNLTVINRSTGTVIWTMQQEHLSTRIDCDPASDLMLVHISNDNHSVISSGVVFHAATGERVREFGECMVFSWPSASILFDRHIYMRPEYGNDTLSVIDAYTGHRQVVQVPHDLEFVGIVPRYLIFRAYDKSIELWDRMSMQLACLIESPSRDSIVMDLSRRQCLVATNKGICYIDVHGKMFYPRVKRLTTGWTVAAFNSRWLVVVSAQRVMAYDFMPRRVSVKRTKI